MSTLQINVTNIANNTNEYFFSGYCELWAVKIPNDDFPPEEVTAFVYERKVGNIDLSKEGTGQIQLSDQDKILATKGGGEYYYYEIRYYPNVSQQEIVDGTNFVPQNLFYVHADSPEFSIDFSIDDAIQDLTPTNYNYQVNFGKGAMDIPLSNLKVLGVIKNASNQTLLNLGALTTNSRGSIEFSWAQITDQNNLALSLPEYPDQSISAIAIDGVAKETNIVIEAPIVDAHIENIIPDVDLTGAGGLYEVLGITPDEQLNAFLASNSLTSLRRIRKKGGVGNMAGYDDLSAGNKEVVGQSLAHARLNLVHFVVDGEDQNKIIEFNQALFAGKGVDSANGILKEFTPNTFVEYARTLPARPSDFRLASMYSLAERQVQMSSNLLSYAAVDRVYAKGGDVAESVFENEHPLDCECKDCTSAVSPLSYLASLLSYAEDNVYKVNGGNLSKSTIENITNYLCQPIDDLPVSCEQSETKICSFRNQVEILYKYGNDAPTTCDTRNLRLQKKQYLELTYKFLLEYIGTSYYEIFQAQNQNDKKAEVAERIGIVGIYNNADTIKELYFDLDSFLIAGNADDTDYGDLIVDLEKLLEAVFNLPKDSYNPVTGSPLEKAQYLKWREEFTKKQWETQDTPVGAFLDVSPTNYYIDPDIVNPDDIRYYIDETKASIPYKPIDDTDSYKLWENRKKWREESELVLESGFLTQKGFQKGINRIKTDLDHTSTLKVFASGQMTISNTILNQGAYQMSELFNWQSSGKVGIGLSTPLPDYSISSGAIVKFQVVDEVSSYNSSNTKFTIASAITNKLSSPLIQLVSSDYSKSMLLKGKYGGTDKKIEVDLLNGQTWSDIQSEFPAGSFVVLTIMVNVFDAGGSYDMTDSLERTGDSLLCFKDKVSDLVSGKEIQVSGSDQNNGTFVVDSSITETLNTTNYNPTNYPLTRINIDRLTTLKGSRTYLNDETGSGELRYYTNDLGVSSVDNGSVLSCTAGGLNLSNGSLLLSNDQILIEPVAGSFSTYRVASRALNNVQTNNIWLQERISEADKKWVEDVGILNKKVAIVIDPDTNAVSATEFLIAGRNLAQYMGAGLTLKVYPQNDYSSPIANSGITLTPVGSDTQVTLISPNPILDTNSRYVLVIEVDLVSYTQNLARIVLSTPPSTLIEDLIPGEGVRTFNSALEQIQELTCSGVSANEIFVQDIIVEPNAVVNCQYQIVLALFSQVLNIDTDTNLASANNSLAEVLSSSAFDSTFSYTHAFYSGGTAPITNFNSWDLTNFSGNDLLVFFQGKVNNLEAGLDEGAWLSEINMSKDAFVKFTEIYKKQRAFIENPRTSEKLEAKELLEIQLILQSSIKKALAKTMAWTQEEGHLLTHLKSTVGSLADLQRLQDPRIFQLSTYAPKILTLDNLQEQQAQLPRIDGQFPLLLKLPESRVGVTASATLSQRESNISSNSETLSTVLQQLGFDGFVQAVWAPFISLTVEQFFNDIINTLYGTDLSKQQKVEEFITNDLMISRDEFESLNEMRNRWASTNDLSVFSSEEVDYLVRLLATSYKQQNLFPFWKIYEKNALSDGTITDRAVWWKVAQVGLKPWVCSPTKRIDWVKAIRLRFESVAIEPDLLNLRYIKNISDASEAATYRAYTLYKSRNLKMENWQVISYPNPAPVGEMAEFKYNVCYFLKISDIELVGMMEAYALGVDISDRLRQLYLSNSGFYRLAAMYKMLLVSGGALTNQDKNELLSILVQVKKERHYCVWKDEEVYNQSNPITISNQYFKEPNAALTYDSNNYNNSDFKWRFNHKALRKWQRKFQSRDMIWDSLEDNMKSMLREADDEYALILRNAWVDYVGAPSQSLEQKAAGLSDRLMLDFKTQCCATTTRVSTAISALQNWYYTLNTETTNPANEQFKLQAPHFDKEWKWLGSYGSFRSAMFVYLYPENLLHPSLRREQSPKFKEIVSRINEGGRFTPETACGLAKDYEGYLRDVETLQAGCSANALVLSTKGKCDDKKEEGLKKKFFSFAKGGKSGKVYYSILDYKESNTSLVNWDNLSAFNDAEIYRFVGTASYKNIKGERHLYLFVIVKKDGATNLAFVRFDLDGQNWDEEYSLLELPDGAEWFNEIVIVQSYGEKRPPMLVWKEVAKVGHWSKTMFHNELNSKGDDWKFDSAIPMTSGGAGPFLILKDAVEVGNVKSNSYNRSVVVIYEHSVEGYLVVQPWGYQSPAKSFGSFNNLWPGKFYGFTTKSTLVPAILETSDVFEQPSNEYGKWKKVKYQGCVAYNSNEYEFVVLYKESNSKSTKAVKFKLNNESTSSSTWALNNLLETFLYYFNWNPFWPEFWGNGRNQKVLEFLVQMFYGYKYITKSSYDFDFPGFENSRVKINLSLKYSEGQKANKADFNKSIKSIFENLGQFYSKDAINSDDDSTFGFMNLYFQSFFAFQKDTSKPAPDINSRPTLEEIFRQIGRKEGLPKGSKDLVAYRITGELKPSYVSMVELGGISRMYSNSFLSDSDINDQLVLYLKKGGGMTISKAKLTNTDPLSLSAECNLAPFYSSGIPITPNKDSSYFQTHRPKTESMLKSNANNPNITNYQAEGYYFLPMLLGITLHEQGYFEESLAWFRSVYDYQWKAGTNRKIYYGLVLEEFANKNYDLAPSWLQDPLNPHQIALTRTEAYTSYTITSIVKCLLDYADQEYTTDTVETVNKATLLYEEAQDLMNLSLFQPNVKPCECSDAEVDLWKELRCMDNIQYLLEFKEEIDELGYLLNQVKDCTKRTALIANAKNTYLKNKTTDDEIIAGLAQFQAAIEAELNPPAEPNTYKELLDLSHSNTALYFDRLMGVNQYDYLFELTAMQCYEDNSWVYQEVTGYNSSGLNDEATELNFLLTPYDEPGNPSTVWVQGTDIYPDERKEGANSASGFALTNQAFVSYPLASTRNGGNLENDFSPMSVAYEFCVPFNPVYESYTVRAELNLFKIRNCMNIAGMKRDLDPYAAPTDTTSGLPSIGSGGRLVIAGQLANKPTQYRYPVLIQRAKELTQQAQQLEGVYLASLEKKDAETYTVLKAKQDLKLSKAGVKLSDYKLRTSENEVELAEMQRSRYELQVSELDAMISSVLSDSEILLINAYAHLAHASTALAQIQANLSFSTSLTNSIASVGAAGLATIAAATGATPSEKASNAATAVNYSSSATISGIQAGFAFPIMNAQNRQTYAQQTISNLSLMASAENRERDWKFQKVLAEKDIEIAGQQIKIAQSRVKVSSQEKKMAEMQEQFAEESLEFLKNKFTNAQLYGWMTKILGGAYSTLLNQATAIAKMAEQQISFERQDTPPVSIGDDYWESPAMSVSLENTGGPDMRGLTGSYRLLQDISRLDQWAFTEDKRKMEVSKSYSLAQKFPMEFQELKLNGEMVFNTMLEDFDRDFPGQYMRIIRKVTVNVVALVPPVEGIKATLTHAGNSEVVIKGDRFQKTTLRRQPEMIAFSSPENATGMLELQPLNPQMFNPFEGNGVAGMWEFAMDKESNFIDYDAISDVIVKIDYTCFHNFDYETIVRRNLDPEFRGERLYSFRNEFADQFYQLANPESSSTPFKVQINTSLFDFPRNLKDVYIRGIRVMIAGEADVLRNTPKTIAMAYREQLSDQPTLGVAALDKNNFAGTIGGGGTGLVNFLGKPANGYWEFDLNGINTSLNGNAKNLKPLKQLFENGQINDLLFVIDFAGSFN